MNIDKLERLAGQAGMYTDLMRMGAASLVYSPGCKGVALDELQRFVDLVVTDALAAGSISLSPCHQHQGQPFSFKATAFVPSRTVCPICTPDWQSKDTP